MLPVRLSRSPLVIFTDITSHPSRAARSISSTGSPTPVPSAATAHCPRTSGRITIRCTCSTTRGYVVPSGSLSRYRTTYPSTTGFPYGRLTSIASTTAIADGSCVFPKSSPI